MRAMTMKKAISNTQLLLALMMVMALFTVAAHAAAPGITGTTFNLIAQPAYLNQPDGQAVYSWGYGCNGAATFAATLGSATFPNQTCPTMQVPGPTLVVRAPATVTVTLTNGLPAAAGNTSI